MGVSLHYRGKIKDLNLVDSLVEEVADICDSNRWEYQVYNDEAFRPLRRNEDVVSAFLDFDDEDETNTKKPDLGLRGITFRTHEESESVSLLFDKNGVLTSFLVALFPAIQGHLKMPWSFTKTQFAGYEAHIKVVNLLVYLKKKYFKRLDIRDDGGYYPDNDEEALRNRMGFIDNAIDTLNDLFENGKFEGNPDEVMDQIQDAISATFGDISIKVMRFDPDNIPDLLGNMEDFEKKSPKPKPKRKRRKKNDEDNDDNQ
jgi:hypothetical protein